MVVEKFDIADPLRTQAILERYQIRAQKSWDRIFYTILRSSIRL